MESDLKSMSISGPIFEIEAEYGFQEVAAFKRGLR